MIKKIIFKLFKKKIFNNKKINEINYINYIRQITKNIKNKKELNFLHSGLPGDIINSLAVIKKISQTHKCNLFININKKIEYEYFKHPGQGLLMNNKLYEMIFPLIKKQNYISNICKYDNSDIDINLDYFRLFPAKFINPPRYYFHLTGEKADLNEPYLEVEPHPNIKNKIVILRSFRFRNNLINYNFLKNFNDLLFIGLESEFEDLKQSIPNLQFYDCKDFYEMSQIIKSAKFFLGNQSLGYAIADALNVPRLLENCKDYTAVQPEGKNAFDFFYQIHFEKWFNYLNSR